jgi:sensor histidine kinase YesM
MDSSQQRNRLLILHASFWAVYISFFIYARSSFQQAPEINWPRIFTIAAIHILPAIALSYLTYFYFLPQYLFKKRVALFALLFITAVIAFVSTRILLERYFIDGFTYKEEYLYRTRFVIQSYFSYLSITLFVSLLRFAVDWLDLQTTRKEIEKEKLTAELNFLKAQVNPHFLFNTLNNLYYLAYSKSENTTEVIEKLSLMMRYMIYDSNYPKVQLSKEIDYMKNYISLEKMRLSEKVDIQFTVEGDSDSIRITPLILLTFLENAFKHGVTNTSKESWIKACLKFTPKELHFKVANSKPPASKAEEKSGIGLQNVKRRLELSYPGKHRLEMSESAQEYSVQLDLTLE